METYWNRRPVTKAVQANSVGAIQHWLDSLSPADLAADGATISDFVISLPDPGSWRIDYVYYEPTGTGGPLYVAGSLGDYLHMRPGGVNLHSLTAAEFFAQYEPTTGV